MRSASTHVPFRGMRGGGIVIEKGSSREKTSGFFPLDYPSSSSGVDLLCL